MIAHNIFEMIQNNLNRADETLAILHSSIEEMHRKIYETKKQIGASQKMILLMKKKRGVK